MLEKTILPRYATQMVALLLGDIMNGTRKPMQNNLLIIARKIIRRSPASFQDAINGNVVGDNSEMLMLQLKSRKENQNRT